MRCSLSSSSLTISTAIEQEESDTTLYGCIEDSTSVVVVSLMFFCNSFSDILTDKSEIVLYMLSHSRVREELSSSFNAHGTLGQHTVQKNIILLQLFLRTSYSLTLTLAQILCSHILHHWQSIALSPTSWWQVKQCCSVSALRLRFIGISSK